MAAAQPFSSKSTSNVNSQLASLLIPRQVHPTTSYGPSASSPGELIGTMTTNDFDWSEKLLKLSSVVSDVVKVVSEIEGNVILYWRALQY